MKPPAGTTKDGAVIWALPRPAGRDTGLWHLTWSGPGRHVHLHAGGIRDAFGDEWFGQVQSEVSGSCATQDDAQRAVDAYITTQGRNR